MANYYGYTRVSTSTQVEKGGGLDVQRKAIERYAKENGITVAEWFEDAGISGTTESRPALDRMIDGLEKGDVIIVHNTSRLWRDLFSQATVMKSVMNAKANIYAIDNPSFDVYEYMNDPEAMVMQSIMCMLDWYTRRELSRKMARGRAAKANRGGKPCGICPFGYQYTADKKGVEVVEADAAIVKRMFTEAQKGHSLQEIADIINGLGSTAPRGGGWTKGTIQAVLRNRFYTGVLLYQGKEISGNHEAIISKIQFGKVAAQLDRRHK